HRRLPHLSAQGTEGEVDLGRPCGGDLEPPPLETRNEARERHPQPEPPRGAIDQPGVVTQAGLPRPEEWLVLRRSEGDDARLRAVRADDQSVDVSSSSGRTSRSTVAGFPTTTTRGGTSFTTTAPAPTNASSPISTAGHRTAPTPTRAPRRIVGPLRS